MISEVYAMAAPPAATPGAPAPGILQTFVVPMAFVFMVFYFLMIRPQKKRELAQKKLLDALKKGDEVITQSGIYGRVAGVAEQVITLEIAPNTKIKINRAMVAGLQKAPETSTEQKA